MRILTEPCKQLLLTIIVVFASSAYGTTVLNLGSGPQTSNRTSAAGMNINRPDSWSPAYLFVDAALKARKWISHSCTNGSVWDNGSKIGTDAEGWVTSVVSGTCPGLYLLDEEVETVSHYVPLGTYVLIWEGEGTLMLNLLPNPNATCKSSGCAWIDSRTLRSTGTGPHKATFDLTDSSATATDLRIMQFSAAKPVRRIRVIMPGGLVATGSQINYQLYCKTARGPHGPTPNGAVASLPAGQTCKDFQDIYWDRYRDGLMLMHKSTDLNNTAQPPRAVFHPLTLRGLSNWRFLRAMDWMHTNNSTITSWGQRTYYKHVNQVESDHGVAFEYLLTLANVLGSDVWINIPHRADDNYVNNLAAYLRDNLHPSLKVYVEYSNEIWNNGFPFTQGSWVEAKGVQLYPSVSKFEARLQYQADRSARFADLFKWAFAAGAQRVIAVIAGQAANTFTGDRLLNWRNTYKHVNAYAIAPYFGAELSGDTAVASYTLDRLFGRIATTSIPAAVGMIKPNAALASSRAVRLIAYELGQHLTGADAFTKLFVAANRDYRMGQATLNYLNALRANGLQEFGYYNDISVFRKFGSWGARESQAQENVPKLNAINSFKTGNPCWWSGCSR